VHRSSIYAFCFVTEIIDLDVMSRFFCNLKGIYLIQVVGRCVIVVIGYVVSNGL
jgi:hypothetical protein